MIPDENFARWLHNEKKFSHFVAKDVISRLKRASRMHEFENNDLYLFYLTQTDEFQKCTTSVRSQLKRAVKLYQEFIQSQPTN